MSANDTSHRRVVFHVGEWYFMSASVITYR